MNWDLAQRADEQSIHYRKVGCFELANHCAESGHALRDGGRSRVLASEALPLHEQIELSRSDERVWDRLKDAGVSLDHFRDTIFKPVPSVAIHELASSCFQ